MNNLGKLKNQTDFQNVFYNHQYLRNYTTAFFGIVLILIIVAMLIFW